MKWFDRFADKTAEKVASAWFFFFCVLLVIIWAPTIFIMPKKLPPQVDTWQLVINTATTIITFLMVALLHNDQHRFEKATNARLMEIIDKLGGSKLQDPVEDPGQKKTN